MTSKKLSLLAIVAVISLICAITVNRVTNRLQPAPAGSVHLIQGLAPGSIDQIMIKKGDEDVALKRGGSSFLVTNKDSYPADTDRINELLTQLLDVQSLDLVTSDEQNYSELGVTEKNAENIISFKDKDDKIITGLIIGKRADGGNSYVRLIDGKDVYLCRNIPYIRTSATDYTNQELLEINKDDIIEVTVTDSNGITYTLKSEPNSTDITLSGAIPEGKKLASAHKQVFEALTSLRFNDVMSEKSTPKDTVFDSTYICRLEDSSVYVLKIAKSDNKTYAKFSASFKNKQKVTIDPTKKESDEELKRKEKILLGMETIQKFSEKTKGWVYEIPSYKADNLTKSLDEIIEDVEPPKEANTNNDES